jgi:hypothetical protein
MSNYPSSTNQFTNLPERSGFCNIFFIGYSVNTRMAKYGLSLRVETIKAKANFSIRGYLSSAPWSALLVKYIGFWIPESSRTKA